MDQISHLPMSAVDAASYREPANSLLYGVPTADDVFEMAPGELPSLKPTSIFGDVPEGWNPRPRIPSGKHPNAMADILYARAVRGQKTGGGINAVGGLPADALFPGSPAISANHMRSVIPITSDSTWSKHLNRSGALALLPRESCFLSPD